MLVDQTAYLAQPISNPKFRNAGNENCSPAIKKKVYIQIYKA